MSLQTVLAEIEPAWYAPPDEPPLDPRLLARARGSALGERVLARWLAAGPAQHLLAPTPQREIAQAVVRWPRERLLPFLRDLGVLAMAPAIRAEVGREAVRRLKQALGNSYLLALDRTVWDGRVPAEMQLALGSALHAALRQQDEGHDALYALLDRQGRAELRAWAREHDQALGEWAMLLHAPEPALPPVLPAQQVQLLHEHHLGRARSA